MSTNELLGLPNKCILIIELVAKIHTSNIYQTVLEGRILEAIVSNPPIRCREKSRNIEIINGFFCSVKAQGTYGLIFIQEKQGAPSAKRKNERNILVM